MDCVLETLYGVMIIGPAGSGKTSLCKALSRLMNDLNREVILVNLDPDNEYLSYQADIDIRQLVKLTEVMQNENLGPNGAFLFCIEMLDKNFDWLKAQIVSQFQKAKAKSESASERANRPYIVFDCPGQSELFTTNSSFKNIITKLCNFKKVTEVELGPNKLTLHFCSPKVGSSSMVYWTFAW